VFSPDLPPDLDRGPEKTGPAAATSAPDLPQSKPDLRSNPSLNLTAIRVNVEPKGPELPFPEKDIGLEL